MATARKTLLYITFGYFCFISTIANAMSPIANATPIHEAFISKFTDPIPPVIISKQPPAAIIENIPTRPANDLIWIPGYWAWLEEKNDYTWVCGVWRRAPPRNFWIPGTWNEYKGGWAWSKGFWSRVALDNLYHIEQEPPHAIDDKVPIAPAKDYFWIPGYWQYSIASKSYSWLSGKWELFNENWVLAPASYVWTPSGYYYAPMYWDWSLEKRGSAYVCSNAAQFLPVLIEPEAIIQQLYSYYPDYLSLFWHLWHFHQDWWDDCICVPQWWVWTEWWTFPWGEMWGFWWWWTHPDFLPPIWVTSEVAMEIPPPPENIVKLFEKIKKPFFEYKAGDKAILPTGIPGFKHLYKPHLSNDVTIKGSVTVPPLPIRPPVKQVAPLIQPTPEVKVLQPSHEPPQTRPPVFYPSDELEEPPRYYSPDRPYHPRRPPPVEPQGRRANRKYPAPSRATSWKYPHGSILTPEPLDE